MRKKLPLILLSVLLAVFSISMVVYASTITLQKNDKNWSDYQNTLDADNETYPYSQKAKDYSSITINHVSLDIAYGVKRKIVVYHGELPWEQTHKNDGTKYSQWSGYYCEPDTSIYSKLDETSNMNPNYKARISWGSKSASIEDFWGYIMDKNVDDDGNWKSLRDAETINEGGVVSLRIYAMSQTIGSGNFIHWISNLFYNLFRFLAGVGVAIVNLIIMVKNISLTDVMETLHLDKLNDIMVNTFIYNSDVMKLSPFMIIAILFYMVSVGMLAYRYATGKDKVNSLWNLVITALIGLLFIGVALSGRISSLGGSISNFATKLFYSASSTLDVDDSGGNAFAIDIQDKEHENEIVQLCEMSLINQSFIKLQICSQFNVTDIKELNVTNLGDTSNTSESLANKYLVGFSNGNPAFSKVFNNNLGYYFWFADSSAEYITSGNATLPPTNAGASQQKLSSMITYLQVLYNKGNSTQKQNILHIIDAFANPNTSSVNMILSMLFFTAILVMLCIVLIKYVGCILLAKLTMFISLLGICIAGPLMLTTNKKLVQTGWHVLGMMVISFLEITVYSIIFDIILFTIASLISTDLLKLIVVGALLALLLKLNPIIAEKIRQLLEKTERQIAPEFCQNRSKLKNWSKQKLNEKVNEYDRSTTKTYDENGNVIEQQRAGNALSKLMHQGVNALSEGREKKSFRKINSDLNKTREKNLEQSQRQKEENAKNNVNEVLNDIDKQAEYTERVVDSEYNTIVNSTKDTDANGNQTGEYNVANLTDSEKELYETAKTHQFNVDQLKDSQEYQELLNERHNIAMQNATRHPDEEAIEMDIDKANKLAMYEQSIKDEEEKVKASKASLEAEISTRAFMSACERGGIESDAEDFSELLNGKNVKDVVKDKAKLKAQDEHKDELQVALEKEINVCRETVNTKVGGKIGSIGASVNQKAVKDQAAAMYQLEQLKQNQVVSSTNDAKREVADVVDMVKSKYDGISATDEGLLKSAKEEKSDAFFFTKKRRDAKDKIDEIKDQIDENNDIAKDAYKDAKENRGGITRLSINECISGMVANKVNSKPIDEGLNLPNTEPNNTENAETDTNNTPRPGVQYNTTERQKVTQAFTVPNSTPVSNNQTPEPIPEQTTFEPIPEQPLPTPTKVDTPQTNVDTTPKPQTTQQEVKPNKLFIPKETIEPLPEQKTQSKPTEKTETPTIDKSVIEQAVKDVKPTSPFSIPTEPQNTPIEPVKPTTSTEKVVTPTETPITKKVETPLNDKPVFTTKAEEKPTPIEPTQKVEPSPVQTTTQKVDTPMSEPKPTAKVDTTPKVENKPTVDNTPKVNPTNSTVNNVDNTPKTESKPTPVDTQPKPSNPQPSVPFTVTEEKPTPISTEEVKTVVESIIKQSPKQPEPQKVDTPIRETPTRTETIVKEVPIKETVVKEQPIKEQPTKETPIKEPTVKEAPIKEETIKVTPIKETQTKESPIKEESPLRTETPIKEETPTTPKETKVNETKSPTGNNTPPIIDDGIESHSSGGNRTLEDFIDDEKKNIVNEYKE